MVLDTVSPELAGGELGSNGQRGAPKEALSCPQDSTGRVVQWKGDIIHIIRAYLEEELDTVHQVAEPVKITNTNCENYKHEPVKMTNTQMNLH